MLSWHSLSASRNLWSLAACSLLVVLATSAGARAQISVPGDFATIQAAIDAAVASDTIEVGPGTYAEPLNFLGKTIVVRSTGGAEVTTLDGSSFSVSVVRIPGGSGAGTRLQGFTIQGGSALTGAAPFGGGVRVTIATATIADCVFTGNTAQFGGGAAVRLGGNVSFENCSFVDNSAHGGSTVFATGAGGAVHVEGTASFNGCRFTGNHLINHPTTASGAVDVIGNSTASFDACRFDGNSGSSGALGVHETASATLTGCSFSRNTGELFAGAVTLLTTGDLSFDGCRFEANTTPGISAGAIHSRQNLQLAITRCEFVENEASALGAPAGALYLDATALTLADCRFFGNRASLGGGVNIGLSSPAVATITNCRFEWNVATFGGGMSLTLTDAHVVTVTGCSFTDNEAVVGGGLYNFDLSEPPTLSGSSFCGNANGNAVGPFADGGGNTFSEACVGWSNLGTFETEVVEFTDLPPGLIGLGELAGNDPVELQLGHAPPSSAALLYIALQSNPTPFKGGTLAPVPALTTFVLATDSEGALDLDSRWPVGLPSGFELVYQYAIADAGSESGCVLSNAIRSVTP